MYLKKYFTFSKDLDKVQISQVEKMNTELGNAKTKNRKKMQDNVSSQSFLQISPQ